MMEKTPLKRQAYLASHSSHVNPCGNATTSITVEQIHFGSVLGHYQSNESNDMDVDTCLKINNYEDTVCQLDMYYGLVKRQLLHFQSPSTTGLFPAHSIDTEVASVRDSINCASAIWGLYQAYRQMDDDRGTLPHHGVGTIFDRVLTELVSKTKEMKIDLAEMGCLRAIIFFNPDAKGRKSIYRRWKP